MKSKISCWRLVRSIPAAPCSAGEDCSTNVCSYDTRGSDGNKRRLYWPRPRGGGGIGRRARLRALWGDCPVEVRVLFAASEAPQMRGFLFPEVGARSHLATTNRLIRSWVWARAAVRRPLGLNCSNLGSS